MMKGMFSTYGHVEVHTTTNMILDNGKPHAYYHYDELKSKKAMSNYVRQVVQGMHRDNRIKRVRMVVQDPCDGFVIAQRDWRIK